MNTNIVLKKEIPYTKTIIRMLIILFINLDIKNVNAERLFMFFHLL